jgi:hypothetical protein
VVRWWPATDTSYTVICDDVVSETIGPLAMIDQIIHNQAANATVLGSCVRHVDGVIVDTRSSPVW